MKLFLLKLWCRIFRHKPHYEPIESRYDDTIKGFRHAVTVPYCERCGARDLYGWVKIKGYMEQTDGNVDAIKGKRPA